MKKPSAGFDGPDDYQAGDSLRSFAFRRDVSRERCHFDFALVEKNLDGEEERERQFAAMSEMLGDLLVWIVTPFSLARIARKTVALVWLMRPELLPSTALGRLAPLLDLKGRASMSYYAVEAARIAGIRGKLSGDVGHTHVSKNGD